MKYWNRERIRRKKERRERAERKIAEKTREAERTRRTHTPGDPRKNARLMLDALGSRLNRMMLERLRKEGAMSVSRLAEPFHLVISAAVTRVNALERAGLITTKKQGRIRFCIFNPAATKELSVWFAARSPFDVD